MTRAILTGTAHLTHDARSMRESFAITSARPRLGHRREARLRIFAKSSHSVPIFGSRVTTRWPVVTQYEFRYRILLSTQSARAVAMEPSSIAFASPSAAPGEQDERERMRERSMRGASMPQRMRTERACERDGDTQPRGRIVCVSVAEGRAFRPCPGSRGVSSMSSSLTKLI